MSNVGSIGVLLTSDRNLKGDAVNRRILTWLAWATFAVNDGGCLWAADRQVSANQRRFHLAPATDQ